MTANNTPQLGANVTGAPDGVSGSIDFTANADSFLTSNGYGFTGTIGVTTFSKVELLLRLKVTQQLDNDAITLAIAHSAGALATFAPSGVNPLSTAGLNTQVGATGDKVIDITSVVGSSWTLAQVQTLAVKLTAAKSSDADDGNVLIDAIGVRVTGASSPGTYGSSTIFPLPLVDTYDSTKLEYISASIPPTSTSTAVPTAATLSWSSVSLLNAGTTQNITVTFRALAVTDTNADGTRDSRSATNTATSTNAYFVSGLRTNDANSNVIVTVTPTGSIGNYIFWDVNANNAQDAGDIGLGGVVVSLYTSANVLYRQTVTDASGAYLFRGVIDGTYYVKIATAANDPEYSLPWPAASTTVTFDPDGSTYSAQGPNIVINNVDTVTTNDNYTNQDFGFDNNTFSLISGTIFTDHDGDGVRDVGDEARVGVTVTLSGSGSGTVTTDANGFYSFGSLAAGTNYIVTVTAPGSTTNTLDPDGTKNSTTTVNVAAGTAYPNKDFAYNATGSFTLGDTLYYDYDGNGAKAVGEPGIANVTTYLYYDINADGLIDTLSDALVATSVTNGSGVYGYTGLAAGNYIVAVDLTDLDFPAGVLQTQDYDGTRDSLAKVNLTASIDTVDFGYVLDAVGTGTGSIGNVVWLDSNNDGLKGTNESGIDGVTVQLYRSIQTPGTDTPMATTTTSGGGLYSFTTLPHGDWIVYLPVANFTSGALLTNPLSSSTTVSTDNQVNNDDNGIQSAISTATRSPTITLTDAESDQTVDFGFNSSTARIGDTVFYDLNANGSQDYNETGINGVTVNLYLDANDDNVADGAAIMTTTTATVGGDPGVYAFTGLAPNRYIVKTVTASGPLVGMLQTSDPDFDGVPATLAVPGDNADTDILLSSGANYTGADFGYQPPGTIGDFVWLDVDRDGIQDLGEPPLVGVTVRITNGTTTYNVVTDVDGHWAQTVADGTNWVVSIPTPPTGTIATYDAQSGTSSPDSSVPVTVASGVVTVPSGLAQGNLGLDFGFALNGPYSLSGTIAIHDTGTVGTADDVDNFANDGVDMDAGVNDETELSGVEVSLFTSTGTFLGSTFTDADGNYSFAGLPNGSYRVIIGTTASPLDNATLTTTTGNNLSGSTVTSTATSVKQELTIADSSKVNVDFTFNSDSDYDYGDLPASYGMTTLAQDGARHIIPVSGAIYLGTAADADTNGLPSSAANGDDLFGSDDESGVTAVSIGNWADGAATVGTGVSNVTGGDIQVSVTGSGWLVGWVDWNNDKDFLDSGEMIISQAVTTNGALAIPFAIPAGTISSTVTESWLSRFRLFPTEPEFPTFSYTGEATNGEVEDYLFEKTVGGSIGDLVWRDTDGDGVIDAGENGIGGVVVELRDASNVLIKSQTTSNGSQDVDGDGVIDPVGYYRFRTMADGTTPLPDATYKIFAPTITGYTRSYDQDSGTSSPDGLTTVVISSGNQYLLADFGYQPQVANLSGQVRYDTDTDGNPADSDSGATGVTIQLWTDPNADGNLADGVQVAETVTDGSGNYTFTSVASGSYVIVEVNPTGSTSTYDVPGTNEVSGGNDDKIPVTMAGSAITGRDFLDTATYSISGIVYNDFNYNSVINVGTDTLLVGVTVKLYTDENNNGIVDGLDLLIGTAITDGSGVYSFSSLPPGDYLVVETDPTDYKSMTDADGSGNGTSLIDVAIVAANITGRNFLDYLPECPDTWAEWQTEWVALSDKTYTGNPDNDRYKNLVEYAFCLPPNSGIYKPFCLEPSLTVSGGIDGVFRRTVLRTELMSYGFTTLRSGDFG